MVIVQRVLDEVRAHARDASPRECCGMLIGIGVEVRQSVRAANLATGTTRFEIDPRDHFRAIRAAREQSLDVVGFYHSHPRTPADPSETDRAESGDARALHLIVGWRDDVEDVRVFLIERDAVTDVPFRVI